MSPTTLLRALKRFWWAIVALAAAGAAAGAGASLLMTPSYESTSRIFVTFAATAGAGSSELVQANNFAVQKAFSYVEVAQSPRVLNTVIDELGLDTTAELLAAEIDVTVPTNSVVIHITASAPTAGDAAILTQTIVDVFTDVVLTLEAPATGGTAPVRIESLETAVPADAPATPDVPVNIALGTLAGLALGAVWVAFAATRDRRIHNSGDALAATDFRLRSLGSVPRSIGADAATAVADRPLSAVAEAYRTVAATLGHSPGLDTGVIAVASATPRDSSSSALTANLAHAMTDFGARVVIIDANLRSGDITRSLGLSGPGLAECLLGGVSAHEAVTRVNGIDILPSGSAAESPAELISGKRFQEIVRDLAAGADVVLIDSAPVLPLSDTLFAAAAADATILALTSGSVTARELRAATESLASVQATIAGLVVLNAPTSGVDADIQSAAYRDLRPQSKSRS